MQEVRYANAEEKENSKAEEVSLVLYEMTSVQEFLPVLSVIPEVRSYNTLTLNFF